MKKFLFILLSTIVLAAPSLQAKEKQFYNLTPTEFAQVLEQNKDKPDWFLLDIRTPGEYTEKHLAGSTLVDMSKRDFSQKIVDLDRNKTYMLYCAVGGRSWQTMLYMSQLNFKHVYNMKGGIEAWKRAGLPVER